MKENKKYIIGSILVLLSTMFIVIFTVSVRAENNTTATVKEIDDEKTLIKTTALLSRGISEDDIVNKDMLTQQLNIYAGNGVTSVTEKSSDILVVTFLASGREYEVNVNTGKVYETALPTTAYTAPYLPTGFTYVVGTDLDTGLVIQDSLGNQYVWVEVPRTSTVYPNTGLNITSFSDDEYISIENDLHTYTSVYRNSTSYKDIHSGNDNSTGLTSTEYTALKNKMLKSIYQNGGFYVGRYEAGTTTSRASSSDTLTTPVIQTNAYPYNFVTNSQAQTLANNMSSGEYISSLMFGVQWDLVLKYLETKGISQTELNSNSTEWGNYSNSIYNITNTSAKYYSSSWLNTPYNKTSTGNILLTTGASSEFSKQGIYDIAGNVYEWTLEYTSSAGYPCSDRGGGCSNGGYYPASFRTNVYTAYTSFYVGFRVALY